MVKRFVSALLLDEVVLGGGNAKKLKKLPEGCRLGDNANALLGGFLLWRAKDQVDWKGADGNFGQILPFFAE